MTSAADTVELPTLCADDVFAPSKCAQLSGLWLAEFGRDSAKNNVFERFMSYCRQLLARLRRLRLPARPNAPESNKTHTLPLNAPNGEWEWDRAPSASSTLLPQLSYAAMIDAMLPPEDFVVPRNREASAPLETNELGTLLYAKASKPEPVALAFDDTKPNMRLG